MPFTAHCSCWQFRRTPFSNFVRMRTCSPVPRPNSTIILSKLTWTDHVSKVRMKATRVLNLLRRAMQGCSKQAKAGLTLPCSYPSWDMLTSLDNLSERCPGWSREGAECAARWICAKWDKANYCWTKTYEECCSDLNWATVYQRHLLLTCCQAYKIINNLDCLRFDDYFCFNQSSTRSHWLTLRCASSRIRYFLFINLPFIWNTIPFNSTSYGVSKLKLF